MWFALKRFRRRQEPARLDPDCERQFTQMERIVIAIGIADPVDAGAPSRDWIRVFLFPARPLGLANPRLEALRAFTSILSNGRGEMLRDARSRAVEAGFDERQLDALTDCFK